MHCEYRFSLTCRCPEDESVVDYYRVTVTTDRMFLAEYLIKTAKEWEDKVVYQEHLTQALAERFRAKVETVGRHSGVETLCVCGGGS